MSKQKQIINRLCAASMDSIIVGSLGTISLDLKETKHPKKILVRGAMGCVVGVGLGLAMNQKKPVVVLVGDGSFLMKMGSMATVLRYKPENLSIYVLDNNRYESTGGQKTNSEFIDFPTSCYFHRIMV